MRVLFCLLLLPLLAFTAEPPRVALEFRGAQWAADSLSCTIPFTRVGNLIVVQAKADTTEGNFILDSGAPGLVLNITYFREYAATVAAEAEGTSITGSSAAVVKSSVKAVNIGLFENERVEADLVNLAHLENSRGIKILGLLGVELFRQCEMILDFEEGLIYLHRIGKKESKTYQHSMLSDTSAYRVIPFALTDNRIIINSQLAGKKLKLIVDCAAESSVLDSRLPDPVFEYVTIIRRITLTGADRKKVDALYGNLEGMQIGTAQLATLPVVITNLEKTCFSYSGCVDGVLGFDFLSLQKVGFNFVQRKMYLWK